MDTAIVTLKFANGAIGVIDNSRQAGGYDQRVEVFGSKGMAKRKMTSLPQLKSILLIHQRRIRFLISSWIVIPMRLLINLKNLLFQ